MHTYLKISNIPNIDNCSRGTTCLCTALSYIFRQQCDSKNVCAGPMGSFHNLGEHGVGLVFASNRRAP